MNQHAFRAPDEFELIEFFGGEPIERVVEDGYWCFEAKSAGGTVLRFSINILERSVQTDIRIGPSVVASVTHELAMRLVVERNQLRCDFFGSDCRTSLTIDAAPTYAVSWSTLRTT
jgi:hypothetical protein